MISKMKGLLLLSSSLMLALPAAATPPGFNEPGMGRAAMPQTEAAPRNVQGWWPNVVDLNRLRQNEYNPDPNGADFDYAAEFAKLDLKAVKADINAALTDSQEWWPADYGNYAGLFIRLAWHSAGTYRSGDGRGGSDGGQIRFEPLNSWPDNGNLDKARRVLWPVKQKYGAALSWSDLIILAGNVALENTGFTTFGFAGGRADAWEPELVYWGPETKFLTSERNAEGANLDTPLAASEMGLIYVNPEGPEGNPDILKSAQQIRTTFGRMGMNDEETAALVIGGHTIGKMHGARKAADCVGKEPAAEGVEAQGLGWKNTCGTGVGKDATTSGLEGAWTVTPIQWSSNYLENLYGFEWKQTTSPAGAKQWEPVNAADVKVVPDAFDPNVTHSPVMLTTDLALRYDPAYGAITSRWAKDPKAMDAAFARAWFKLTHRDLGPKARYVGVEVPAEDLIWQDPLPKADYAMVEAGDIAQLKQAIRATGLSRSDLVRTAWASAVTFRDTDMRGGANGARIRLAPQKDWGVNDPATLAKVVTALEAVQAKFNAGAGAKKVSIADLVVLGGVVAVEDAAKAAGQSVTVPFTAGRTDATEAHTDAKSFELLRPAADAFRNFYSDKARLTPTQMLIDQADTLGLTVPEMTVLLAGMRMLDANSGGAKHGVFTDRPGTLSNDFFVNLLDMGNTWKPAETKGIYEGRDRATGALKWTATEVDLVFGSNSELRAVAETYAVKGGEAKFAQDFAKAWNKVMMLDRFDLR